MNKRQKEVQQVHLDAEKEIIRKLQKVYEQAREDCTEKIWSLAARTDIENMFSIIYQKQYQQAIRQQIDSILDALQTNEFDHIAQYLTACYENGFVGALYDLQGQGIPLIIPINQEQVVQAIQVDTKLSINLYSRLGEDISKLKANIRSELSRGISTGSRWSDIASRIANKMTSPFTTAMNRAITIARTEGHRIQQQSHHEAAVEAKKRGTDVVKQWDSTLDNRTRESHKILDGQVRELDEYFEVNGHKALYPGSFGVASEDIHCRCCELQRARWALSAEQTRYLGRTDNMSDQELLPMASKLGISVDELRRYSDQIIPVKAKDYVDFRRQYNNIWHYEKVPEVENASEYAILKNIKTLNGIKVSTPSKHMLERALERGVSVEAITNALKSPLNIGQIKTDSQGRRSQRFIGTEATVNVNPDNGIVTTIWKTGSNTRKKYEKE